VGDSLLKSDKNLMWAIDLRGEDGYNKSVRKLIEIFWGDTNDKNCTGWKCWDCTYTHG